jgi:AmmeMemoRadiSam system protein B
MITRTHAVAGLFYPSDPTTLAGTVDDLLAAASPPPPGRIRAVVSPHAGYQYSGRVAAHGLAALARSRPRTVVVVGPSHVEYFSFTSVFDGDAYATPLGNVPVDRELARRLADGARTIRLSQRGHVHDHLPRGEHGLEVQLPFLQRAIPDVTIVPIVMGEQSWAHCDELGLALRALGDDTAVVASSDLSHFYPHEKAETLDRTFAETLTAKDARMLHDAVASGRCEACGAGPVTAALRSVEAMPSLCYHGLARTNSAEVTGDRSSVVGYLCAVFATLEEQ